MTIENRLRAVLMNEGGNYILPFFWQHGEDEAKLREYMQIIHDSNIREVCVESRPHPDFLGEKWWADMDAILDEAKKLEMRVWILDDKHFPTGYAAGAMEKAPKELCHQYLDYNMLSICGPTPSIQIDIEKLSHPKPIPPWMPPAPQSTRIFNDDHFFAAVACVIEDNGQAGQTINLTPLVTDGQLIWDVPEGYWQIFVIYLTRDARGRNDYINFLDADSCKLLIDAVYEPHYARYSDLFGNVIAGFFSDEPPIGNTPGYTHGDFIGRYDMPLPWSRQMPGMMTGEYGENWEIMLPYLWTECSDKQQTARIRTSYMNAVSKLVSTCFSNQIGSWCETRNVEYIGHMLEDCDMNSGLGPSMGHFFRGLSGQHMSGIDNIGGQVVIGGQNVARRPFSNIDSAGFYHYTLGRLGTSLAAIDPNKQGRCMCENFGAYGWQIGVHTEKYLTDHFLARGVNRFVPHAFSPQDFPDPDCPPHFFAHGENPEYRVFGELMAYTNRICHLIDGGKPVAPVAVLYHGESQWAGQNESNIAACRQLTRNQIGFLIVPADVFDPNDGRASYDETKNLLLINDVEFSALVISDCEFIPEAAASFAAKLIDHKFPVILTGSSLTGISELSTGKSTQLVDKLKSCAISDVAQLAFELDKYIERDVKLSQDFPDLTVYRYRHNADIFLILNENPSRPYQGTIQLPAKGKIISYNAWNNSAHVITVDSPSVETSEQGSTITVDIAPLEMRVYYCAAEIPNYLTGTSIIENIEVTWQQNIIITDFTASFCDAKSYPQFHSKMEADLKHGMGLINPAFSGFIRYEAEVNLQQVSEAVLEVENIFDSAEIIVNGKSAGFTVSKPHKIDISKLIRDGRNNIVIDVATKLERKALQMGIDAACMGIPAPMTPIGLVGKVVLKTR